MMQTLLYIKTQQPAKQQAVVFLSEDQCGFSS